MKGTRDRLLAYANRAVLSHAYILEGKRDGDKETVALEFAHAITPYPEDIVTIELDGLSIKDAVVEDLQERLSMKPFAGERIVAVVKNADTMTHRAQNRLLKTLEEPKGKSVILLLSENIESLLPTIVSRCVVFRMDTFEETSTETGDPLLKEKAEEIGKLLLQSGRFYAVAKVLEDVTSDRELARSFLEAFASWIRMRVIESKGVSANMDGLIRMEAKKTLSLEKAMTAMSAIEEARRDLDRYIKPSYALKSMMLKLI